MRLAIADKGDKQIADELRLSRGGLDWHWRQIKAKAGKQSRVAAVVSLLRIPVVADQLADGVYSSK